MNLKIYLEHREDGKVNVFMSAIFHPFPAPVPSGRGGERSPLPLLPAKVVWVEPHPAHALWRIFGCKSFKGWRKRFVPKKGDFFAGEVVHE